MLGFIVTSIIGSVVVRVRAQAQTVTGSAHVCADTKEGKSGDASQIDQTMLEELNQRISKLESEDSSTRGKNKVVVPFQVVDRSGRTIFYVNDEIAEPSIRRARVSSPE